MRAVDTATATSLNIRPFIQLGQLYAPVNGRYRTASGDSFWDICVYRVSEFLIPMRLSARAAVWETRSPHCRTGTRVPLFRKGVYGDSPSFDSTSECLRYSNLRAHDCQLHRAETSASAHPVRRIVARGIKLSPRVPLWYSVELRPTARTNLAVSARGGASLSSTACCQYERG
jgi:hypothetical protein